MDTDEERSSRVRRWVRLMVIAAAVVVLLVVIVLMIGGHGPARHFSLNPPVVEAFSWNR